MREEIAAQYCRQVLTEDGGVGKHTQMALDAVRVFLQVVAQVLKLFEHHACMDHKCLAGWREAKRRCLSVNKIKFQSITGGLAAAGRLVGIGRRERETAAP